MTNERFQEVGASISSLAFGCEGSKAAEWEELLNHALKALGPYSLLISDGLSGIWLGVFILDKHLSQTSEMQSAKFSSSRISVKVIYFQFKISLIYMRLIK